MRWRVACQVSDGVSVPIFRLTSEARLDLVCPVAGSGNVIGYRGCDVTRGALPARSSTGCLLVLLPRNSTS